MVQLQSVKWYRWDDMPKENVTEMLDRRLITGDRMMLAHVYLKKGAIVPRHSHENEQLTYILEGALRFWIGEDESEVIDVRAGRSAAHSVARSAQSRSSRRYARCGYFQPAAAGLAR